MAGHSKWSSIKHKKGAADKKRGAMFTKLTRAIQVAARDGADPKGNAGLALAIQKARDASMPKDNIERAVAKGAGLDKDAAQIEEVVYEGYAPAGVALLIHCFTDNRNRTGADVRSILTKNGGSLGEPGSVAYNFEKKGSIVVAAADAGEDDLMVAIDAGAEDIVDDDEFFEVVTEPGDFVAVREAIEAAGITVENADVHQRPKSRVAVSDEDAAKVFRVIELLEENDDVNDVAANFEASDAALEALAAAD